MRNSDQMTTGKTHPTVLTLYIKTSNVYTFQTIDFVTKTEERANYWADVFNQKLHFEVKLNLIFKRNREKIPVF